MIWLCITYIAGILTVLVIEAVVFHLWFSKQDEAIPPSNSTPTPDWDHIKTVLDRLNSNLKQAPSVGKCTASFINVVTLFLFQELRDDTKIRGQVLARINNEISDILNSRLKSKIIKTLSVHNFSAGTAPPKFSNVYVNKLKLCEDSKLFRKLHISVDVQYEGCGKLALQATTFMGKNMYLSVEVTKLVGRLIFIFSRNPQTHWGFCFDSEPEVEFNVISAFQNRRLPKFTKVVSSILRHAIRKKHTKPNYKRRYAPLFKEPFVSLPPDRQFFVCKEPLVKGKLAVKLISANRVVHTAMQSNKKGWYYCTVSLSPKMWDADCCALKQSITFDTVIPNVNDGMGITFNVVGGTDHGDAPKVVVDEVQRNSPASESNIKQGDVITAINNKKASSFKAVLAASLSANRAKLSLRRPLLKWNKIFTSGEASQDMAAFDADAVKVATFVEDEEFMILEELEIDGEETEKYVETSTGTDGATISSCETSPESCRNTSECLLRTQYCPISISPFWDEHFLFKMQESQQYLTVCLWKEETPSKLPGNPVLIGFCNLNLADVILQCLATTSYSYNESALLTLPCDLKWQDNIVPRLGSLPQVLPKMDAIAGEVKLQLTMCTTESVSCEHTFVVGQVEKAEKCAACFKRVVHKTAYICTTCGIARHERCLHADPAMSTRHNSASSKMQINQSSSFRNRSFSVQTTKTSEPGSFAFLRGLEKKAAIFDEKLHDLENKLRDQITLRKTLLDLKSRCPQVPPTVQEQLQQNAESIKGLTRLREQLTCSSD